MLEKTLKLSEEIKVLMKEITTKTLSEGNIRNLTGEEFELYKRVMGVMNSSLELMEEQARTIDEMNRKLDLIVHKVSQN